MRTLLPLAVIFLATIVGAQTRALEDAPEASGPQQTRARAISISMATLLHDARLAFVLCKIRSPRWYHNIETSLALGRQAEMDRLESTGNPAAFKAYLERLYAWENVRSNLNGDDFSMGVCTAFRDSQALLKLDELERKATANYH
jgi:hypothetical protein